MGQADAALDEDRPENLIEPCSHSKKVCRYTIEPTPSSLTTVREFIKTTLRPFSNVEPHIHDIVFATHEACKNAVEHNPECEEPVDIVCEVRDGSVMVEVADRGKGFDPAILPPEAPEVDALDGRGIFMIYSMMDAVEAQTGKGGTRIRMLKLLPAVA